MPNYSEPSIVVLRRNVIYSKYPPFSLMQLWICISHLRHSVAVTLSRISGDRT